MRWLGAAVVGGGLVLALTTGIDVPAFREPQLFLLAWLLPPAVLLWILWARTGRPADGRMRSLAPGLILCVCLAVSLASAFPLHRWFFFLRWLPEHVGLHRSGFGRLIFWSSLLTPLFLFRRRRLWVGLVVVLLVLQYLCLHELMETTGGKALYRTDHPSFMFRLHEFSRTFPQLVNYNPYWKGGTLHFVGVTSGTAAPGLALFPLWRLFPIHTVYTFGVGVLFVVLVPWIGYGSIRAMGGDRAAAAAGGLLTLGVSQHFFLWMLHFGTIGASLAGAMILPVSALSFRVVRLRRRDRRTGLALVLAAFFLLLWPPGALMGVAVAVAFLLHARRWTRAMWVFLGACGALVLLLHSRWLMVQFDEAGSIVQYVLEPAGGKARQASWLNGATLGEGWTLLLAHIQEGHPVLIFLGLAGVLTAARRSVRSWFAPILLTLALITGWGQSWKPHSQFARFAIPMFFVAVAPASMLIGRLLRARDPRLALVRSFLVVLLALGAYNVTRIYENEGRARYVVLDETIETMADWVRREVPEGGRLLFAGRCVHAFGRGNVAYLPILTGREMMADDYYGFPAGTIEYEYPPRPFRKSLDRMRLFFDAYNVTHVVTYHDKWKRFFNGHPDLFREELSLPSHHLTITFYKVLRTPRPLFAGQGRATARFNRIDVKLENAAEEIVLPYNWIEGLKGLHGVEIYPRQVDPDITLIGCRPRGRQSFSIVYRNWF